MAKLASLTTCFIIFSLTLLTFSQEQFEAANDTQNTEIDYENSTITETSSVTKTRTVTEVTTVAETNTAAETRTVTEITSVAETNTVAETISTTESLLHAANISNTVDNLEPSHFLSSVHNPNPEEFTINSLSNSILTVTKEVLSFTYRSAKVVPWQQRLEELKKLPPKDIADLLAQRGIIIPPLKGITCDLNTQYYRTLDGSCNNFLFPCFGKAHEPYLRWLPPAYANGIDEPRKRANGHPLPSPRQVYQWVSSQFEQNATTVYSGYSNLIVVWGQTLAHDILLTPTVTVKVWDGKEFKEEAPNCCAPGASHPDCFPIVMNYDDGYYPRGHCLDIARSAAYVYSPFSCQQLKLGLPREQMNQVTSFIDASLVYGTSEDHLKTLREHNGLGAKLIMDYSRTASYPPRKDEQCKSAHSACDKRCFLTGEKRANENPVLGAMHTIWVREHNRLVDALRIRGWPEETLFHVVRKIVGALFQHITYNEYLPKIIGPDLANLLNLTVPTNNYHYSPYTNPTLYNVFVAAAFRYGHSMISARHMRRGRQYAASPLLSQDFFSMDEFCNPHEDSIASILYGQADQKPQKVDCMFSKQITNHLFASEVNGAGLDLFSLNIQRGRDHGLPPYNKWREACGLPKANQYSDLRGTIPDFVVNRLMSVYGYGGIDEIDLYIAGVSEFPVNGGILGPTFTCIVANQFKNLKFGDRFWYENTDHPGAFTPAQINSIRKTTLASLLCRNSDIKYIQPQAFQAESVSNPKLHCQAITRETDLDFSLWP